MPLMKAPIIIEKMTAVNVAFFGGSMMESTYPYPEQLQLKPIIMPMNALSDEIGGIANA